MSCPELLQIKELSFACLMKTALRLFKTPELQAFYEANGQIPTSTMTSRLAELIYYRQGSDLAAQKEWNRMTRLQLEHKLRSIGLLEENEVLSDWQLRLRLAGAAFAKKALPERQEFEQRRQDHQLMNSEEGSYDATESEREIGDRGDGGRKTIYTKNHGQKMVI